MSCKYLSTLSLQCKCVNYSDYWPTCTTHTIKLSLFVFWCQTWIFMIFAAAASFLLHYSDEFICQQMNENFEFERSFLSNSFDWLWSDRVCSMSKTIRKSIFKCLCVFVNIHVTHPLNSFACSQKKYHRSMTGNLFAVIFHMCYWEPPIVSIKTRK